MEPTAICTVTPVERSKRKLVYLPSHAATGYFDYCEEMGCEWEGLLNSIPEKFDSAALIELPDFLRLEGESKIASGFEARRTAKSLCLTAGRSRSSRNVSCYTFKASRMKIPMIS